MSVPFVGYKAAGNCIIELEIDPQNALTNLDRDNVVDKYHAKFRCNKALILKIYDKITGYECDSICSDYNNNFIYKKGKVVEISNYDTNKNNVCAYGIHFFLTKEAAFFYNRSTTYNSPYESWYDNGQPHVKCDTIINDRFEGQYESWHENGQRSVKCNYKNGQLDGQYESWFENGQIHKKSNYKNGQLDGQYESWFENGQIRKKSNYKNNQYEGRCDF